MTGRTYAQINCSLTRSKKLARLTDHKHRWAYICAHLSDTCSFSGLFRYPQIVWADDAALTREELLEAIDALSDVDLIEYDRIEQVVRIVSWYHKKNCPENASRMIGHVADYLASDVDNPGMYLRSVAEFLVGSVRRAQGWKSDSPDWPKLRDALGQFARKTYQEFGDDFLSCLATELGGSGNAVRAEIIAFCPPLDAYHAPEMGTECAEGVDTLSRHETKTRRDLHETKTKTETKTETVENSEIADPNSNDHKSGEIAMRRMDSSKAKSAVPIRPVEETKRSAIAMRGT